MSDHTKHSIIYPALSGILLGLSMPPLHAGFIAWGALVPLFFSLRNCSLREAFKRGAIFCLVFNAVSLHFISFNSGTTFGVAFSSYLATILILFFYGPLFALPAAFIMKKTGKYGVLLLPFFWTSVEFIKSLGETASPWNIIPLSQSEYLFPIQIVSVTGIWGISFWAAMINALLFLAFRDSRKWYSVAAIWTLIPFLTGALVIQGADYPEHTVKACIIQGNVDPAVKWANSLEDNLNRYRDLSIKSSEVEVMFWPEAAIPAVFNQSLFARSYLRNLAQEMNTPILTGSLARDFHDDGEFQRFNSAFLIRPEADELERYDKIHLVPGGERMPFQDLIPAIGKLNFGQAEFTPGTDYHIFQVDSSGFGVMICFESIFPDIARNFTRNGADFLVNITNDGWYGKSAEPYQQALLTRYRAIENRRSLVRSANTGISYFTDGYGRFIKISRLEEDAVLISEIPIYEDETFYCKYGDVFAKAVLQVSLVLIILTAFRRFYAVKRILIVIALILLCRQTAGSETRYLTFSTSYTRSLSLASPAAMEGNLLCAPVNPAGFSLYENSVFPRITVALNPVGAAFAFQGMQEGEYADGNVNFQDLLIPVMALIKGLGFSYKAVNIGVILGEQNPYGNGHRQLFKYEPIFEDYYNRIYVKLQLDKRVELGVSVDAFAVREEIGDWGYSYGVILKPGKLHAGVFYNVNPSEHENDILTGYRLPSETISAGLSWQPIAMLKMYGGLRNIAESQKSAFMEPHSGLEFLPWEHTALRAGYYLKDGEQDSFSLGIGILDMDEFRALQDQTKQNEHLFDYSFTVMPDDLTLHSISLHFRF